MMYLKKTYFFAWGQRLKDLLITYSRRLHAGCQLIETLQPSASCTLAGSSVFFCLFFFKKVFLETSWFPLCCDRTLTRCEKPQKTLHFHNVTVDDADTAVMSTRQGPTQAFIIYYLSQQEGENLFNSNSNSTNCFNVVKTETSSRNSFFTTAIVDEAVEVNTFHHKDHSYSNIYCFLQNIIIIIKYFNRRSSK